MFYDIKCCIQRTLTMWHFTTIGFSLGKLVNVSVLWTSLVFNYSYYWHCWLLLHFIVSFNVFLASLCYSMYSMLRYWEVGDSFYSILKLNSLGFCSSSSSCTLLPILTLVVPKLVLQSASGILVIMLSWLDILVCPLISCLFLPAAAFTTTPVYAFGSCFFNCEDMQLGPLCLIQGVNLDLYTSFWLTGR